MTKSECYYMYVKWNISVNLLLQVDCDDVSAYPLDLYGCQPVVYEVEIKEMETTNLNPVPGK